MAGTHSASLRNSSRVGQVMLLPRLRYHQPPAGPTRRTDSLPGLRRDIVLGGAMTVDWTPFRWPGNWTDPSLLSLLQGTAFNYILIDKGSEYDGIRSRAREAGFQVADPAALPDGIVLVKGEWAGVRMSRGQGGGTSAGPTGVPWVNSNGWAIRLAATLHPNTAVWVQATPAEGARITRIPTSLPCLTAPRMAAAG